MSEFNGTPGPWVAVRNSAYIQIDSVEHGQLADACMSGPAFDGGDCFGEISIANANLIAAAPELLSVLQLILSYHDDGNCKLNREDVAMARAVLAKALGQTPQ